MAVKGRFRVEVSPRFTPDDSPPAPPAPVSPALAGPPARLTELAVLWELSGEALDAELASVRRKRSELAAYEAGLIERKATLGAAHTLPFLPGARTDTRTTPGGATTTAGGDGGPDPALQAADDFLPDEVAAVLNMSVPSARYLVDHALVLVRQLPDVWHALADGRVDETRAKVVVRALGWQASSSGGPVADPTIADLALLGVGWAERGCPPSTLAARLDAALIAADPAAADRRKELRGRAADVVVAGTRDGLADLRASHMPSEDATLARAQLDAYAKKIKADGDPRPIGAIRVAVLAALIARPWEKQDPAVAHVTINADLSDLGHLPGLQALLGTPDAGARVAHDAAPDAGARVAHDAAPDAGARVAHDAAPDAGARVAHDAAPDAGAEVAHDAAPGAGAHDAAPDDEPTQGEMDDTAPSGYEADHGEVAPGRADQVDATWGEVVGEGAGRALRAAGGRMVGHVDGQPVGPAAVQALLQRIDALGLTDPYGGHLTYVITGSRGRLLAVAGPDELVAAARAGAGLGPPPLTPSYRPTAAQYRYLRARDQHCRFPGCRAVAVACDADHVVPYDRRRPADGGPTCVTNLVLLCRHHHRLKTHAVGWRFELDTDGTLHVTTPGGTTRTTRPPAADHVLDLLTEPPPPHDPAVDLPPF